MRIPIEWLGEYVDLKGLKPKEISDALNSTGTENEVLSELQDFPGIVVGEIMEINKHPNADRLNVTKTKVGKNTLQIVCGAPNIEVGQKIPVALVGAKIGEFEIKEAEIRGVKSFGMLCSEQELGISEDHEGIMVLNSDAKVGQNLSEALARGGAVLEAELTPNRSDCFSVIGIAREVAVSTNRKLKSLNFKKVEVKSKTEAKVSVKEAELCPRYIAKVIDGIKVGQSPKWLQERLSQAGIRPINNVVDVTNYVMLEWGQPLHAFDEEKVQGEIIVRKAKNGEKIKTLDGVERSLGHEDLVIADSKKAIGIAGVMGGASSEVSKDTKKIILEAAVFNGTSVRKTAQRLALRSEASNRFEKGIPLGLPEIAIERAASLLEEVAGAKSGPNVDVLSKWIWVQHVGLSLTRIKEFLGIELGTDEVLKILKSLGFEAEKFDFKKEARKHVGKPYVWGASFKTHGDLAFDCSYLTDYIYSKIGKFVGYTSLAQFELGEPVQDDELQPGDVLFVNGVIEKSVTDHYFIPGQNGYERIESKLGQKVGHNAIYIGGGRIIHARHYQYDKKVNKWVKAKKGEVVEENVEVFFNNPEYLGARRFVEKPDDWIAIDVPWWRLDVKIEEDIFEEIARIYGYDNFPSKLPSGEMPSVLANQEVEAVAVVRNFLTSVGLFEVVSYSFLSGKDLKKVNGLEAALRVSNPISKEQEYMRTSLIPNVLKASLVNQANYESFDLFEIGKVYFASKEGAEEEQRLALASRVSQRDKNVAFYRLKGFLESLVQKGRLGELTVKKSNIIYLEKGQQAEIFLNGNPVGYVGMVAEKTLVDFGLKTALAVAEINWEKLTENKEQLVYKAFSRFPQSKKDISLMFPKKIEAAEVLSVPKINGILQKAEIIDIYQGKGLQEDEKSVTISLSFGSSERTLSESEVTEELQKLVRGYEKLGGKIRN